ncbi:DUF2806 domain-containing protein [Pyxidicoccus trucidator]|uniref:DUF2806 domain-containing protein n=1 Tax=Pyxidicoccus trucidator TaxID=2709662 RepID=UPI0013DC581F|nr:DUF2806 domain-containing protein [Pyxidicoccus trucidator]
MSLEDITGLSKPLQKLIEVVSDGIGAIARPWIVRRDAKALADANRLLADGGLTVGTAEIEGLSAQIAARVNYQESKRQRNLSRVVEAAQKALPENVSEATVDPDWTSRFFSSAQEISNEEMQQLWGRLLAGEIAAPGSFSLRALDCLRNLTSSEARAFSELCDFVLWEGNTTAFLFSPYPPSGLGGLFMSDMSAPTPISQQTDKVRDTYERRGLTYQSIILLSELNLIHFTLNESCSFKSEIPDRFRGTVRMGARYLTIENEDKESKLSIPSMSLTSTGRDLFKLHIPGANADFETTLSDVLKTAGFRAYWTAHPPQRNTEG